MTISRTHLAGLELALANCENAPGASSESLASAFRALIAKAQAAPEAEPVAVMPEVCVGSALAGNGCGQCSACLAELDSLASAAPQHDADHIPDTTKMVDAELVELLRDSRRYAEKAWPDGVHSYRKNSISGDLVARIDAKLATLKVKP